MRTTLTIDDDVMDRLQDEAHRKRLPFRQVVNAALRRGLTGQPRSTHRPTIKTYASKLRPGFDPGGFNQLADELEAEAVVTKLGR